MEMLQNVRLSFLWWTQSIEHSIMSEHSIMKGGIVMTTENEEPFLRTDFENIQSEIQDIKNEFGIDMNFTEKHWAIIEAAIKVFSEKGFSAGRTSEIAKEAGVSEGTIFNYFKTKQDLLQGMLMPFFLFVTRPFILKGIESFLSSRPETPVDEALTKLALDLVKLIDERQNLVKTMVAEAMFHPDLLEPIRKKMFPSMMKATQKVFDSEIEHGTFRKVDSLEAKKVFIGMIFAHVTIKQSIKELRGSGDDESEIRKMVDIFLHGVSNTMGEN
jgi:AcrR family transcriptional regulator